MWFLFILLYFPTFFVEQFHIPNLSDHRWGCFYNERPNNTIGGKTFPYSIPLFCPSIRYDPKSRRWTLSYTKMTNQNKNEINRNNKMKSLKRSPALETLASFLLLLSYSLAIKGATRVILLASYECRNKPPNI